MTNQGSSFDGQVRDFIESYKIALLNSSPYYAQVNGQVDSSSKTLIKLIKKKIEDNPRRWHEVLSNDEMSTEVLQEGESAQDPSGKIMEPWAFSVNFPYDTQFTFNSLMFVAGEDGNLELLTQGPPPKHPAPIYG
jgi:hypothetical protein